MGIEGDGLYRPRFTMECGVLSAATIAVGVFLIVEGQWANSNWPGKNRGDALLVGGALLVMLLCYILARNLTTQLKLTKNFLYFKRGSTMEKVPWDAVVYRPIATKRKFMRRCLVGDSKGTIAIDSMFFPNFDEISSEIGSRVERLKRERA